jgi:NADPH-dependent 2,4-dienoyl-CoA reductase/sulfur reductase-like enzyme
MGAGGLPALAKSGLPVEGKRVVVAGTGPLPLAVAAYLRKRGAELRSIAEQAPWRRIVAFSARLVDEPAKFMRALSLKWKLRAVPYVTGCHVVSAEGAGKVERVVLADGGGTWTEPCDYLAGGFGLVPERGSRASARLQSRWRVRRRQRMAGDLRHPCFLFGRCTESCPHLYGKMGT